MTRGDVWLLLALFAADPAIAQDAAPLSKSELRREKPSITDRLLKDQLWSIFRKQDRRTKKRPEVALSRVWMQSKPYATRVPGLCRYDAMTLHFAQADDGPRDVDAPSRAYGFDARPFFHFTRTPREDEEYGDQRTWSPWRSECARLDPDKEAFFGAPDDDVANDGYRAMMLAFSNVAEKTLTIDKCELLPVDKQSCAEIVGDLAKIYPNSIDRCDGRAGVQCYAIFIGDRDVRVTRVAYPVSPGPNLPTGSIASIEVASPVIMTHEIRD
jgi:hypothetical protein